MSALVGVGNPKTQRERQALAAAERSSRWAKAAALIAAITATASLVTSITALITVL